MYWHILFSKCCYFLISILFTWSSLFTPFILYYAHSSPSDLPMVTLSTYQDHLLKGMKRHCIYFVLYQRLPLFPGTSLTSFKKHRISDNKRPICENDILCNSNFHLLWPNLFELRAKTNENNLKIGFMNNSGQDE